MTKFKKLFLVGLALALVLGMVFQTTPAFALGSKAGATPTPLKVTTLATIKSMTVLEIYPPQLKITGTLPSSCYQLSVSTRAVSSTTQANASTGMVFIWVRGVALANVVCMQSLKLFSTTVTLDPAKLNLAPGKYVAMVNPVNGQSSFKMRFTVPILKPVLATITAVAALTSYPPQFKITGTVPSCYRPVAPALKVSGSVISVYVYGAKIVNIMPCATAGPVAFSTSLTIDPVKLKLAPGKYMVLFNPVNGASRFKTEVLIGIDRIIETR